MIKRIVTICIIAIMTWSLASCSAEDSRDPEIILDDDFRIFYLNTKEFELVQRDEYDLWSPLIEELHAYQEIEDGIIAYDNNQYYIVKFKEDPPIIYQTEDLKDLEKTTEELYGLNEINLIPHPQWIPE